MRISDWSSDVCSSDLNYRYAGAQPADKFVITNPMPSAVRFADAGDTRPFVSIDGGKQWGLLSDLSISMTDGTRRAAQRSEERRVGKEWVSTCRSRWSPYH